MKWLALSIVGGMVGACGATPNPLSCLDGSCTDPRFPYCDVEGLIDEPASCISVECTPGEVIGCREDLAITCNSAGNYFDLVNCPDGCETPGGCKAQEQIECTTDAECDNPTPICSATMTCRRCELDVECESGVCDVDTGACAAISEVVYASPSGSESATCAMADPCSLPHAISVATSNPLRPWVRLSQGNYNRQIQSNSGTARIVGPHSAMILGQTSLTTVNVGVGGKVSIRGVSIDLTIAGAFCGGVGTSGPFMDGGELHLRDVVITSTDNNIYMMNGCIGSIRNSQFVTTNGSINLAFTSGRPTPQVIIDRFDLQSVSGSTSGLHLCSGCRSTVTNSKFEHAFVALADMTWFAFNSVYGFYVSANGARVENNIVLATGQTDSLYCMNNCTSRSNLVFPQMTTVPGTTVMDPQFVDAPNHDLHLKATSPAVNAAMPQPDLTTDHDFDGVSRPQGPALDIGAFERLP